MSLLGLVTLPSLPEILIPTAVVLGCHTLTTLYLMRVLNPAFDPDWRPLMVFPPRTFGGRYRMTLNYSGAVLFESVRQVVFEGIPYDFRARVDRRTVALCVLHAFLGFLALVGLVVLAVFAISAGWTFWQELPRPVPSNRPLPEALQL